MKQTDPRWCLNPSLLRHVRDARPTVDELVAWLGPRRGGAWHVLRKAGLLREEGGRVALSRDHLSADGRAFRFESQLYFLDEDRVMTFRGALPHVPAAAPLAPIIRHTDEMDWQPSPSPTVRSPQPPGPRSSFSGNGQDGVTSGWTGRSR